MKIRRIISNNLLILKYLIKYTPLYTIMTLVLGVLVDIIAVAANVFLLKYIIDTITTKKSISNIIVAIVIFSIYVIIVEVVNCLFSEMYVPIAKERLHIKMQSEIYEKAIKMDLIVYDNPEFYNDFVWAVSEAETRAYKVLELLKGLLGQITVISSIAIVFTFIDPVLIVLVLSCTLISFSFDYKLIKKLYNRELEFKPQYRKRDYISRLFYLIDYSKEIRINNSSNKFRQMFKNTNKEIDELIEKHDKSIWKSVFLQTFIPRDLAIGLLLILYLGYKVMIVKSITFGDFVALYRGVEIGIDSIYTLVEKTIIGLYEQGIYIDKFRKFIEYEPKINESESINKLADFSNVIELKNLSFSYDNKDNHVLKNINMTIKPNEKIAIVGYNGAGKTTLVKLLMRLYDPTDGQILLNGVDIKNYSLKSYRDGYGAVFQDYQLFAAKLSENVVMDTFNEADERKIIEALNMSDFNVINSLEYGINTSILREFDDQGIILSGGEAQKVAIARVFSKPCKVLVLDEPSSFLDPVSEYNINNTLLKVAENKTVIFISHRLTTTRMVDKIYVLENGEVVEQGNHEELMMVNGRYAKMFNIQADKYRMIN